MNFIRINSQVGAMSILQSVSVRPVWLALSVLGWFGDGQAQSEGVPGASFAEGIVVNVPELGMEAYGLVVVGLCALMGMLIFAKAKLAVVGGESQRGFTVGARILTGVAISIVVAMVMAAVVILRLNEVREQMEAVADLNIIAIDTAILLNGEQREQGILLERILRHGATGGSAALEKLNGAVGQFHQKSSSIETAIGEDIAHLAQLRVYSASEAEIVRETIRKLEHMQTQRVQFNAHASKLFAGLGTDGGNDVKTEVVVVAEAMKLNRLLQDYLLGVEDRAQRALDRARVNADVAVWMMVVMVGTVVVASLLSGWLNASLISRGLNRAIGAVMCLRDGDLSGPPLIANRGDESGVLVAAIDDLRLQLGLLARHAQELAGGQLNTGAVLQRARAGVSLAQAVEQVAESPVRGDLADSFNKVSIALHGLAAQAAMIAADDGASDGEQPLTNGITDADMSAIAARMRGLRETLHAQTETVEQQRLQIRDMAADAVSAAETVFASSAEMAVRVETASQSDIGQREGAAGAAAAAGQVSVSAREAARKTESLAVMANDATSRLDTLSTEIAAVTHSARRMGQALATSSASIEELADGVHKQAETAEAVEEEAQQTGDAVRECARVVREAESGMERICERVAAAATAIDELGGRTDPVSGMITALADISDQSNLVALNASIEAARAGEGGRGLAVVAAEAGKLSAHTTEAVTKLNEMIGGIREDAHDVVANMGQVKSDVNEGRRAALRSGKALEQIGGQADKVSDLVGQLRAAADDQAEAGKRIVRSAVDLSQLGQRLIAAMGGGSQSIDQATRAAVGAAELADELAETIQDQSQTLDSIAVAAEETNQRAETITSAIEGVVQSSHDLNRQAHELRRSADGSNGKNSGHAAEGEAASGDQGLLNTLAEN